MRIAAILYIIASVGANFFVGSLTTFVLAALSFPLLIWLLAKKKTQTKNTVAQNTEVNSPGIS